MTARKNKIIIFFIFSFLFLEVSGQDPHFSQFYANPLYLNPAMAGDNICARIIGNYRIQWPGIGNAFNTYNFSYDQYLNVLHGGIGVVMTADRAGGGNLNTTMISLMYAYKFNITSKLQASGSLKVGYYQRRLAWENLMFEDMIDPRNGFVLPTSEKPPDNSSVGVPDFSAGVYMAYDDLVYGGVAVDHLTQPDIGFYMVNPTLLEMKITVHAGANINLRKRGSSSDKREFSLSPNLLYQQQFQFRQLNVGLYFNFEPMVAGVWLRHNFDDRPDAVIPMLGIHYRNLQVGYSYDVTVSNLKGATGGAHEISASWQFPCQQKRLIIRAIKSPRF